jgi:hypothetical protein
MYTYVWVLGKKGVVDKKRGSYIKMGYKINRWLIRRENELSVHYMRK